MKFASQLGCCGHWIKGQLTAIECGMGETPVNPTTRVSTPRTRWDTGRADGGARHELKKIVRSSAAIFLRYQRRPGNGQVMPRRRFHPRVVRLEIISRAKNGKCACCDEPLGTDPRLIEFDHELSLELGGTDTPDNLRALTKSCHRAKTSREATQNEQRRNACPKGRA